MNIAQVEKNFKKLVGDLADGGINQGSKYLKD